MKMLQLALLLLLFLPKWWDRGLCLRNRVHPKLAQSEYDMYIRPSIRFQNGK